MGLFSKLFNGLKKTKTAFSEKLKYVFSKNELDDDFYEELEYILISSDIDHETVEEIIEEMKERCKDQLTKSSERAKEILKEILVEILEENEQTEVEYPLVIISDTYAGDNGGNKNITIIKNVAGKESYPWIANSSLAIIPIDDGTICSGDTVLLTSLAMKKKMLITEPSTLSEMYIIHGENGISSPKDEDVFATFVKELLFTDKYDHLCENARSCFLEKYSREGMGKKIVEFMAINR